MIKNVSNKYKICFIHIPKTGGSTIEKIFFNRHLESEHLDVEHYIEYDNYFIFSIVRNPYTRIISLYNYYKNGGNKSNYDKNVINNITLDKFIESYTSYNIKVLKPQNLFLKNSNRINYIGKFENLENEIIDICKKVNFPLKHIPHLRKTTYTNNYVISPNFVNLVNKIYKEDFEKYNYKMVNIKNTLKYTEFIKYIL